MRVKFEPQPDITAYELAVIFKNISFYYVLEITPDKWATIEPEVQRHMEILPELAPAHPVAHLIQDDTACQHCGTLLDDCATIPCTGPKESAP